jgi:hypothetical protein
MLNYQMPITVLVLTPQLLEILSTNPAGGRRRLLPNEQRVERAKAPGLLLFTATGMWTAAVQAYIINHGGFFFLVWNVVRPLTDIKLK